MIVVVVVVVVVAVVAVFKKGNPPCRVSWCQTCIDSNETQPLSKKNLICFNART